MGSFINVDNDRCRRKLKAEKKLLRSIYRQIRDSYDRSLQIKTRLTFVPTLAVVYATLAVVCADRLVVLEQKRISKPIQFTLCRARFAHTHNFHSQKITIAPIQPNAVKQNHE